MYPRCLWSDGRVWGVVYESTFLQIWTLGLRLEKDRACLRQGALGAVGAQKSALLTKQTIPLHSWVSPGVTSCQIVPPPERLRTLETRCDRALCLCHQEQ